jgi:hypothetical protein|tara:strand:- start:23 stop:199 length:177 start_codon:yes stop_codon:yes gene_type:complete
MEKRIHLLLGTVNFIEHFSDIDIQMEEVVVKEVVSRRLIDVTKYLLILQHNNNTQCLV